MFATLIDNKIMSAWGGSGSEIDDRNLKLFDNRIKILRLVFFVYTRRDILVNLVWIWILIFRLFFFVGNVMVVKV